MAGPDDILQNAIDGIFVKNAEIPISMDVHLERFEFKTLFVRHVVECDRAEIGKAGLGTDGGVLGDFNGDLITLVLIGECFDVGQWRGEATLGVPFIVAQLRVLSLPAHKSFLLLCASGLFG